MTSLAMQTPSSHRRTGVEAISQLKKRHDRARRAASVRVDGVGGAAARRRQGVEPGLRPGSRESPMGTSERIRSTGHRLHPPLGVGAVRLGLPSQPLRRAGGNGAHYLDRLGHRHHRRVCRGQARRGPDADHGMVLGGSLPALGHRAGLGPGEKRLEHHLRHRRHFLAFDGTFSFAPRF